MAVVEKSTEATVCNTNNDCFRTSEDISGFNWFCQKSQGNCIYCHIAKWDSLFSVCQNYTINLELDLNWAKHYALLWIIIPIIICILLTTGMIIISCLCCKFCPGYVYAEKRRSRLLARANVNSGNITAEGIRAHSSVQLQTRYTVANGLNSVLEIDVNASRP